MEKYEHIAVIGEGSYGVVMKCKHKETNQLVAVKKFLESEEDEATRKITLREIEILKRLEHENLVTLIEVFRYKKRLHLVFEFLEWTVLNELDRMPSGLGEDKCKERIFQVLRAIRYCHANHIIHRDVKPENVLVSARGIVKLCDFGFARKIGISNETCTEYVATRWYRAPELLIGERSYGTAVDIWAVGCLFAEMMTGDPIFPGNSDVDQLYLIVKILGKPCLRHQKLLATNTLFKDLVHIPTDRRVNFNEMFPSWSLQAIDFFNNCMKMNPGQRLTAAELLKLAYFSQDNFSQRFLESLKQKIAIECCNPLVRKAKKERDKSTDKQVENKSRKVLHNIRKNVVPPGRKVKRKFTGILKVEKERKDFSGNGILTEHRLNANDEMYNMGLSIENNISVLDIQKVTLEGMELSGDHNQNKKKVLEVKTNFNESSENYVNEITCKPLVDKDSVFNVRSTTIEVKSTSNSNLKVKVSKYVKITSAYRYERGAKRKRNTLDLSLPFAVDENIKHSAY